MKIKISNLIELVHALEKYEALYHKSGAEIRFNAWKTRIITNTTGEWHELSEASSAWNTELETNVPLRDKQPVWCWDNTDNFSRIVRFYDAKNKCTFSSYTGARGGDRYSSYEPIPMNDDGSFPKGFEWMEEAQKQLKD